MVASDESPARDEAVDVNNNGDEDDDEDNNGRVLPNPRESQYSPTKFLGT